MVAFLEAPKDSKMKTEKDKWKKKLSVIKEELKTTHNFEGAETMKAYDFELFRCFVMRKVQTQ